MARRDLVVIGASLGGLEPLQQLVAGLPEDFNAAVLCVLHTAPNTRSYLPSILRRFSRMPVDAAEDGESIRAGRVLVAIPDHHLMVEEGYTLRLTRGPKESHARPSIDVLFRSAAHVAGPRVIGVILSGTLDDGTAGTWAIKDRGGITVVQSPVEAAYPSMPASAQRHVSVDYTLNIADIPRKLQDLTWETLPEREAPAMADRKMETEVDIALGHPTRRDRVRELGAQAFYTCPECQGSMVRIEEGTIERFRCHTGHAFSMSSLSVEQPRQIERSLWSTLAQLEEHCELLRELANRAPTSAQAAAQLERIEAVQRVMGDVRALALDPVLRSFDDRDADGER